MSYDLIRTAVPDSSRPDPTDTGRALVDEVFPLLRGWLHVACFFLSIPAGLIVVRSAHTPTARAAAVAYAIGLSALFGVSAIYHRRPWTVTTRPRMKRADHATIFVMIAGSYTPLCLLALGGRLGRATLVVVWACAILGVIFAATGIAEKPVVGLAMYMGLGWAMALMLPRLASVLSTADLAMLLIGGVLYTAGGIVLGTRCPDPFPTVFGYHEIWHLMVAAAAACHYVVILGVVRAAA